MNVNAKILAKMTDFVLTTLAIIFVTAKEQDTMVTTVKKILMNVKIINPAKTVEYASISQVHRCCGGVLKVKFPSSLGIFVF